MHISLRLLTVGIVVSVAVLAGITAAGAAVDADQSSSPELSEQRALTELAQEDDESPPKSAENATDGPLAAAGLDQQVEAGTTVLLDGTGSAHEDGQIDGYSWEVDPPESEPFDPCTGADCARVSFRANETGSYEVTLTVEDDQNRTATDALYVEAQPDAVLSVQVDGQERAGVDESVPLVAALSPGEVPLDSIEWYRGDTLISEHTLADNQQFDRINQTLDATGEYELRAVVTDESGTVVSDTHEVAVTAARNDGGGPPDIVVQGPELITESDSRTATYELTGERMPRIRNHWTEWKLSDGETVGTGEQITVEWEPGVHLLRANAYVTDPETREDGEFPQQRNTIGSDGWEQSLNVHAVTVDPAPTVSIDSIETTSGVVSGVVSAQEPFSYLTDVSVSINGSTIAGGTSTDFSTSETRSFDYEGEPGATVRVVATATDERGQTDRVERTVQLPEHTEEQPQTKVQSGELTAGVSGDERKILATLGIETHEEERSDPGAAATASNNGRNTTLMR